MERLSQSPTDPDFVQDPYPFYARARAAGDLVDWQDYGMPAATTAAAVGAILRDRRFGREVPAERAEPVPARLKPFYDVEAHSMLEAEPPRHTRLRGLVLRAFTSARIAGFVPEIDAILDDCLARWPEGPVDVLEALARPLPVRAIARLLGVPEAKAPDLLAWSNAMVGMYQAGRSPAAEAAAVAATQAFRGWLEALIAERRRTPGDDLLSVLIAAEADGARLSAEELVATVILLLNAGHEATVHTLGNGVKAVLEHGVSVPEDPGAAEGLVEEVLRYDPPLHLFTRWCYAEAEVAGHRFRRGDRVAVLLASAGRDPALWDDPDRFAPGRALRPHLSFGAGLHFCVGAPLARVEIARALSALFGRRPGLRLAQRPRYADIYHFHGLERLLVEG